MAESEEKLKSLSVKVKEGKMLIFPGLRSQLSHFRESARNRKIKRNRRRKKERKTQGPKL